MSTARFHIEKILFPGWSHGQRRRHMRFFMLGVTLGSVLSVVFGLALYFVNTSGHP